MSENSPNVIWQGPEFINVLGICRDDITSIKNNNTSIEEYYFGFLSSYKNEILNREILFYYNLLMNDVEKAEMETIIKCIASRGKFSNNSDKFLKEVCSKVNYGFALLKGKSKTYCIKKLNSVIGRRNHISGSNVKWQVDINLKKNFKVSKQHAVIMFNFESGLFEIKCLSEKYPIKVNNLSYTDIDAPVSLDNNTLICIGGESFYFLLPKQ